MSNVTIPYRFVVKRDTAANFTAANTLLLEGEWALETDTGKMKMGDGTTAWNSLPYKTLDVATPCLQFTTDTGSTADSDPGAGLVKWDNATQNSATKLFFDDATADTGTDLSALFTELAASSTTGILHMVAEDGAFKFYKWTGIADGTGYFKFTASHLCSSGGNFADGITVRVAFYPIGLSDAPSDGSEYVRKDGAWEVATGGGGGGGGGGSQLATFPVPALADFDPPVGSAAAWVEFDNRLSIPLPNTAASNVWLLKNLPAAPFTIDAEVGIFCTDAPSSDAIVVGIGVSDGTKFRSLHTGYWQSNGLTPQVELGLWSAAQTFSSATFHYHIEWDFPPRRVYLRITDDGTIRNYYSSSNGRDWLAWMGTTGEANTVGGIATPTKACLFARVSSSLTATGTSRAVVYGFRITPSVRAIAE